MDRKGIAPLVIVAIVVVAAAVVSVGAYVALSGGSPGTTTTSVNIADATSLSFKVDATVEGMETTGQFWVKGLGTSAIKMRMDMSVAGQDVVIVIDGATEEAWASAAGQWMDVSAEFQQYWDQFETAFEQYKDQLAGWNGTVGGEYTYTDPASGAVIRIYEIQVNPALNDSIFQHG